MDYFKEKKVVLVGVGSWGRNHLSALKSLLPKGILGFYEPDKAGRIDALKIAPGAQVYDTYEAILNDDAVAAVVIAAPANLHFPLALEAVRNGKHVFVEKPLALKFDDGVVLAAEADLKGVTLAVGHILLYDPGYLKLKDLVQRGELGDVFYLYTERAKLGTVRTVEDVIFSLASHDVAIVLDLLGARPTTVSCVGTCALRNDLIDSAVINLVFEGVTRAHVFASWLHPYEARRFAVVGSKASVLWEESDETTLRLIKKSVKIVKKRPRLFDRGEITYKLREVDKLRAELADFLECVKSGNAPRSDGRGGLAVLEVLAAAQRSAASGGAAVKLESERAKVSDLTVSG